MNVATWGVSPAFATVGARTYGAIVAHFYAAGSRAPLCAPRVDGDPLLVGPRATEACVPCRGMVGRASWSVTSLGSSRLWIVRYAAPGEPGETFDATVARMRETAALHARPGYRDADGLAATDAAAYEDALAALARLIPPGTPVEFSKGPESDALAVARELRAEERAKKKPGKGSDAQPVELVYRHEKHYPSWYGCEFTWKTRTARVLRKTAKRVFVENVGGTYATDRGAVVLSTFSLDRAELERTGASAGWTTNPSPPASGKASTPGWADVLGVAMPCSADAAKRAYRRAARAAHPDTGGSAEAFARVTSAWAAASQHFAGGAP